MEVGIQKERNQKGIFGVEISFLFLFSFSFLFFLLTFFLSFLPVVQRGFSIDPLFHYFIVLNEEEENIDKGC